MLRIKPQIHDVVWANKEKKREGALIQAEKEDA